MATSDVDVCNNALFLLGADEISSLDEGESDNASMFSRVYPMFSRARLEQYPWNWARTKVQLSRDAASPLNEWTYQFIVPAEAIRILALYDSAEVGVHPTQEIERSGGFYFADHTELYADITENKTETSWPALFEDFVSNALAARVAVSVTGKTSLAKHFREEAWGLPAEQGEGGMYRQVKSWDATQTPPKQVQSFSLIEARFGSGLGIVDQQLR